MTTVASFRLRFTAVLRFTFYVSRMQHHFLMVIGFNVHRFLRYKMPSLLRCGAVCTLARSFNHYIKIPYMKRIYFLLLSAFMSVMAFAQNGGADVDVDITKSGSSSASGFPWLWVIGGIVFIVLLVALLGNRGGTDRVVEKKTIIRD